MRTMLTAIVLCGILSPGARAQAPAAQAEHAGRPQTSFALDTTSQYFYRGIRQSNDGLIVQPALEFTGVAYEGSDDVPAIDWRLGLWNSLHEGRSGTGGGNALWYEADFYLGADIHLPLALTLETTYLVRHSPNGSFVTTEELQFTLAWDDGPSHEDSRFGGFHPHVNLSFELAGGSDAGNDLGVYAELGISPTYQATDELDLTAPMRLGFSLSDYYEDAGGGSDFWGFVSLGLNASMPVAFMPTRIGPWRMTAGIEVLYLNNHNETINGGDSFELIASIGMSVSW